MEWCAECLVVRVALLVLEALGWWWWLCGSACGKFVLCVRLGVDVGCIGCDTWLSVWLLLFFETFVVSAWALASFGGCAL